MTARALALVALALLAGCDGAVRVSLVLQTVALSPAQRAAGTILAIDALYEGAGAGAVEVTKRVSLDGKALVDPERIELRFPDATTSVTLDVKLEDDAQTAVAEVKSAPTTLSHGLTEILLSFMTEQPHDFDMGIDLAAADLAAPTLVALTPIVVGAAPVAAIVGDFENGIEDVVVATSGGAAYKLPHILASPYLGAATSLSLAPIAMQPAFGMLRGQLAAGVAGGGLVCAYTTLGGGSNCDTLPNNDTINAIAGGTVLGELGTRQILGIATSVGVSIFEPGVASPISVENLGPATAVLVASFDDDVGDLVYTSSLLGIRVCHGLTSCLSLHTTVVAGAMYTRLAAVDLDRDGLMDFFAFEGTLGHYFRNFGGTPATFIESGTLTAIGSPVFGDFNGDGFPDLAYITADKLGILVATLAGNTTPVATSLFDVGSGLFSLHAMELDGKPPLDLVVVDTTGKVTPIVHP